MEKIFLPIYQFFKKNRVAYFICLVAAFACTGFFARQIRFEEDIAAILPKDQQTEKLSQVFQNSRFLDRLVVNISLADSNTASPDTLIQYAEGFVSAANNNLQPYINHIDDKVDDEQMLDLFNQVQQQLPLFLAPADYAKIDSLTQPGQLKQTLEQNIRTLSSPAGLALKRMISNDPTGISFIALNKLRQLQFDENYTLYDGYIMTADNKHLMLFVSPAYSPNHTAENSLLLKGLDHIIDSLQQAGFKAVKANYYGATAVSVGNAQQIRNDNLLTQTVAVVFIIVFVAWYFRKKRAPLLMLLPVVFGALFSLALIYFIKGSISVIALGTGSVVLGIAINYSLHVFNHYRHTQDMEAVLQDLSMPMTLGSFTTIGGFLCLQFVESALLKDVGLFAAFSLIGASLFSLIFLPHLIGTKKAAATQHTEHSWLDKLANLQPERNKWLILGIVVLTSVFAYTSRYAAFESDMLGMNYMSPALKEAEADLNKINAHALQSVYLVSSGHTLNEVLQKNEQAAITLDELKTKGIVQQYSGVSGLLLSDSLQQAKINQWNQYWSPDKKKALLQTLTVEGSSLGYKPTAFSNFATIINTDYVPVVADTNAANNSLLKDYIIQQPGSIQLITLIKTSQQNKAAIYKAFEQQQDITVTDKQYLTNRLVEMVNTDFNKIAWMSSLLVFAVLLISYGRIELALATFIPMLITWVWILGIMGLAGIKFNLINIIISTLIFGLGDDYSIFIMDGLQQEYRTGKKLLSSYKSSIFLSAITTIAGLGVLIFAKHPALKSIALISIIGMFCVVVMSQILIPLFFNFLIRNRVRKGHFPWTFQGLAKSIFSFSYFLVGCLLLNIFGIFLVKLPLLGKKRGKYIYHTILSSFTWSLMYIMGNLTKRIINPLKEQFDKPAVVIINHQSFLDILCATMLHPKLLLFTNHWVWNSPFFGNVVKMAGYYPVMEGAYESTEKLADSIKDGYSVVIFPEGTRTPDGKLKRFHKGAFYLAEQMQLDILPVMMHGTGYTMSKSDFLLKDGTITIEYLPRISPDNIQYGEGYAARTKKIGAYFREQYNRLQKQCETPAFFREQLIYNYIYKGPVLEWYMRIKTRLEKDYTLFNQLIPQQGSILDIGCGYGFLSYMLRFTSNERDITGIDYDEEKIVTANHCFSKEEGIRFYHSDLLSFAFEQYDAITILDVLHYLQPEEQVLAIEKCLQHLKPGGVLIIRDGDAELKDRHKGTRLTEYFSTRFFNFNKTSDKGLSFIKGSTIRQIAAAHHIECTEVDETKRTSNVVFVLKK